jgi:hypothetical protein
MRQILHAKTMKIRHKTGVMSNRKIYIGIAAAICACMGGIYFLWQKAAPYFADMPNVQTATCGEMFDMPPGQIFYTFAAITIIYQTNGGDVSSDAKTDAFTQAIMQRCTENNDLKLVDLVKKLAEEEKAAQ